MDQTNVDISKPILSPTRSLDEGFESDPDRISTDSELTAQTPTFDLLHRTDRDGVQHTTITRRNIESSPISSIICLDGESECDQTNDDGKYTTNSDHQTLSKSDQKQLYRRMKSKAPLPPNSNKTNSTSSTYQKIQPRSQSVDRIRSCANDFNKSTTNQNILAGRFVRVTVDPKQQYLNYFKSYKSYHNYQTTNVNSCNRSAASTTGSNSNLYKLYHPSTNSSNKLSVNVNLQQTNSHEPSGQLLSLSNLSSMMPMQYGFTTIKAPKNYNPPSQQQQQQQSTYSSHHQPQSHLVCWTQSIPRQTRK